MSFGAVHAASLELPCHLRAIKQRANADRCKFITAADCLAASALTHVSLLTPVKYYRGNAIPSIIKLSLIKLPSPSKCSNVWPVRNSCGMQLGTCHISRKPSLDTSDLVGGWLGGDEVICVVTTHTWGLFRRKVLVSRCDAQVSVAGDQHIQSRLGFGIPSVLLHLPSMPCHWWILLYYCVDYCPRMKQLKCP